MLFLEPLQLLLLLLPLKPGVRFSPYWKRRRRKSLNGLINSKVAALPA
jgi:hypothetical protein